MLLSEKREIDGGFVSATGGDSLNETTDGFFALWLNRDTVNLVLVTENFFLYYLHKNIPFCPRLKKNLQTPSLSTLDLR